MIVVNIFEAKAKLSEYLDMAAQGERVLICKRNRPIVELHAVQSARTAPRPIGLGRGRLIRATARSSNRCLRTSSAVLEGATLPAARPKRSQ